MSIVELSSLDGRRISNGAASSITLSFSGITGNNCCLVVRGAALNTVDPVTLSATWQAGNVPSIIGVANGAGDCDAEIFALALGDLTSESGDVVLAKSSDAFTALGCSATIYSGVNQSTPIRDSDSYFTTTSLNNAEVNLSGLVADDVCTDVICAEGLVGAVNPGGSQSAIVIWSPLGGGAGVDISNAGSSQITATGATQQMTMTTTAASARAYVAVALAPAGASTVVITDVEGSRGAGKSIPPGDTDVDVAVTGADVSGTTRMYLADDTDFGTATLVEQSIDGITASALNWTEVDLGVFANGPLFLFVVADEGGPGEAVSAAFAVIISPGQVLTATRTVTLTGSESGLTTIVNDLAFVPHGAFIRANGNLVREQLDPQTVNSICNVDDNTSMGSCSSGDSATGVVKRAQASGTNTLIVQDPTSNGAADQVLGTPSLTDDGLDINFSASTADIELLITFFGGDTCQVVTREIQISDGSLSGLPFSPDFLLGHSSNQAQGDSSDTTFSRMSLGFAKSAVAAEQVSMSGDADGTDRNTGIEEGILLRQISGTTTTWEMAITAFTADGFSWSGSNGDSAYVLCFGLDDVLTFVQLWAKVDSGAGGTEELLPDTLIDKLGFIFQMNGSRSGQVLTPAVGYRWDTGIADGNAQHSEISVWNPTAGPGTAEQSLNLGVWAEGTGTSGSITLEGEITAFSRQPTVRWNINPPFGTLFGLFGWENLSTSRIEQAPVSFTGVVPEGMAIIPGAAPDIEQAPVSFAGVAPEGMAIIPGAAPDVEQDPVSFAGTVPIPQVSHVLAMDIGPNGPNSFLGFVPKHRITVADDHTITQDAPTFAGTVPSPTIPVPGEAIIEDAIPRFVGVVPAPALVPALHSVDQDPISFVGVVPVPSLGLSIAQIPPLFVGTVPDPTLIAKSPPDIVQGPTDFVGFVPRPSLVAGASDIIQGETLFTGTVPAHSVVKNLGQQPLSFVGTVPDPTLIAKSPPDIVQGPTDFVGFVPGHAINKVITQGEVPFVGVVPQPYAVILRDPPRRRHLSLGLGA